MNAWDEWLEHEYGPTDEDEGEWLDEDDARWKMEDRYNQQAKAEWRGEL